MSVGERIKKYREQLNLTMKELGELVHISESMISLYEADKNSPKLETVEKMAAVFNINPSLLMFGDEEQDDGPYDKDADKIAELLERPEYKILFDKTKDMTPEEIERIVKIIELTHGK